MNTISLLEKLPMLELNYLLSILNDGSFLSVIKPDDEEDEMTKDKKSKLTCFKNYIKSAIKSNGLLSTRYSNKLYGGRMSANPSIQNGYKLVRGLLLGKTTTDLDMVNCHPVILSYIAKKNNIPTPYLDYYISNRDICLQSFASREDGKMAFIKSINNDKRLVKSKTPELLYNFDGEVKKTVKAIINLDAYKHIIDCIPVKTYNMGGSSINHIMCYYENQILNTCIDYLKTNNCTISGLMYDGLLIEGNHYDNNKLLDDLTINTESLFPNLKMKWSYKAHDLSIQVPNNFIQFDIPIEVIKPICQIIDYPEDSIKKKDSQPKLTNKKSDDEAGDVFIELMGQNIKKEDGVIYMFNENTFLWELGDEVYNYHYSSFREKLIFYYLVGELVKNINYSGNSTNVKNSYTFVKSKIPSTHFLNTGYEKALSLMLFEDGIYDFKRGMLLPKESFDSSYVFKFKINRKFNHRRDSELEDKIKKNLFIDPFITPSNNKDEQDILKGDSTLTGQFLLESLANALLGNYRHKKFYFCHGLSNSGKGIICEALMNTFEGYVENYNGNCLLASKNDTDEAKKNSWMSCLEGRKIMISNEVSMNKKKIDVNMVKKLASGGDTIDFRKNFKNEQKLVNRTNMFFFCNEIPTFSNPTDSGIINRCEYITFERTFVETLPEGSTENNSYYSLADLNLKTNLAKPEYISAFFHLLAETCLEIYKKDEKGNETYTIIRPASVKIENELQVADTNGCFKTNFWNIFEPATKTDELSLVNITKYYNKTYLTNFIPRQLNKMLKVDVSNINRRIEHHAVYITHIKFKKIAEECLIVDELDN